MLFMAWVAAANYLLKVSEDGSSLTLHSEHARRIATLLRGTSNTSYFKCTLRDLEPAKLLSLSHAARYSERREAVESSGGSSIIIICLEHILASAGRRRPHPSVSLSGRLPSKIRAEVNAEAGPNPDLAVKNSGGIAEFKGAETLHFRGRCLQW